MHTIDLKDVIGTAKCVRLIFPHQLHKDHAFSQGEFPVLLIEERLFFQQYPFHKQKLAFHRATMQYYRRYLEDSGCKAEVITASSVLCDVRKLIPELRQQGVRQIQYIDPTDNWLEARLRGSAEEQGIQLRQFPSKLFLTTDEELDTYFANHERFYQKDFYVWQRKRLEVLLEKDLKPVGGKWIYDAENRKSYPKDKTPPEIFTQPTSQYYREAAESIRDAFPNNPGELPDQTVYPITHADAKEALQHFLQTRLSDFGAFQDAIVQDESYLHHSILSPAINVGLLTAEEVLHETLAFASGHDIPLNSLEGFIRQLIGWREFIRAVYERSGSEERTTNFWDFHRKIPDSFWTGTTGVVPIDKTIKKILRTGYAHHIERLMVLGNFMLLCEFDPNEVYRWFMTFFIDAYDWVMVPNVYGMSQFADGGMMSTKPYISGSNYLRKMSDYPKGEWQDLWDALFWRFMSVHRNFFESQPRLGMLLKTWDKMDDRKQKALLDRAEQYLNSLNTSSQK